jgi:tRNA threonylcarbamoyladenosine biosynthesis protein TsaB
LAYLFIDSTYDISIGVLDENLEWSVLETFSGVKASSVLQKETHKILKNLDLNLKDIKSIVTIAGPGFYTGLRLSEGFADVLSFSGLKHYSFYSHHIAQFLGHSSGVWLTKAYRGEYFFHTWNEHQRKDELIQLKDLKSYLENIKDEKLFIHSESAIDDHIKDFNYTLISTRDLLSKKPEIIFKAILSSSLKVDSFYFRPAEEEFKANP